MEAKRMRRSKSDKMIAGVCGGLGVYFGIDPTLIRLAFVLLLFAKGVGVILYLVLCIVLPSSEVDDEIGNRVSMAEGMESFSNRVQSLVDEGLHTTRASGDQLALIIGGILVVFGAVVLLETISPMLFSTLSKFFWPAILILGGLVLLLRYQRAE
jgi:phage shock protein C